MALMSMTSSSNLNLMLIICLTLKESGLLVNYFGHRFHWFGEIYISGKVHQLKYKIFKNIDDPYSDKDRNQVRSWANGRSSIAIIILESGHFLLLTYL